MLHSIMGFMRTERAQRHQFERVVQDAEDHTRIVMTLAAMYDVKPSEARERFKAYCSQSIQSWRECGGILLRAGDVLPE